MMYKSNSAFTQPGRRGSLLEAVWSTVCFVQTIWYCLHPLNRVFSLHLIGFQLCATKAENFSASAAMKISNKKTKVLCLSKKQASSHCK